MIACANCRGPYHEATGHVLDRETPTVLCGPCTLRFFRWVRQHTSRRWGKTAFYEHAATSREKSA